MKNSVTTGNSTRRAREIMDDEKQLKGGIMKHIFGITLVAILTSYGTGCNSIGSHVTSDGSSIGRNMAELPIQKQIFTDDDLMRLVKYYRKILKENNHDVMVLTELSVKMDNDLVNWQQANPTATGTDRKEVERIREHLAAACLRHYQVTEIRLAIARVKQARTFVAYRDAVDAVRAQALEQSRNSLWSTLERENFRSHAEEILAAMKTEQDGYARVRARIMKALTETQIRFVNSAAREDLANIRDNYNKENGKWLNWCGLGCPRDNKEVIINSLVGCDRIIRTDRLEHVLLNDAFFMREKLVARLGRKDRDVYERHPGLPSYESLADYPCENQLLKSVDEQWYEEFSGKHQSIVAEQELTATEILLSH